MHPFLFFFLLQPSNIVSLFSLSHSLQVCDTCDAFLSDDLNKKINKKNHPRDVHILPPTHFSLSFSVSVVRLSFPIHHTPPHLRIGIPIPDRTLQSFSPHAFPPPLPQLQLLSTRFYLYYIFGQNALFFRNLHVFSPPPSPPQPSQRQKKYKSAFLLCLSSNFDSLYSPPPPPSFPLTPPLTHPPSLSLSLSLRPPPVIPSIPLSFSHAPPHN